MTTLAQMWSGEPSQHRQLLLEGDRAAQARAVGDVIRSMLVTLGVLDDATDELDDEMLAGIRWKLDELLDLATTDFSNVAASTKSQLRAALGLAANATHEAVETALDELEWSPDRDTYRRLRATLRMSPIASGELVRATAKYALIGSPLTDRTNAPIKAQKDNTMNRPSVAAARQAAAAPPRPVAAPRVEIAPGVFAPTYLELQQQADVQRTSVFHACKLWLISNLPCASRMTSEEIHESTRLVLAASMPASKVAAVARQVKGGDAVMLAALPGRNIVERTVTWLTMSPHGKGLNREQLIAAAGVMLYDSNFRSRVLDSVEG